MVASLLSMVFTLSSAFGLVTARSLIDASQRDFVQSPTKPTLLLVFQKDCSACLRQVADLGCLQGVEVVLLGAFANEKDLREEYRKFAVKYPAYYVDSQVAKFFNINNSLTPQMILLVDGLRSDILGYTTCQTLRRRLIQSEEIIK